MNLLETVRLLCGPLSVPGGVTYQIARIDLRRSLVQFLIPHSGTGLPQVDSSCLTPMVLPSRRLKLGDGLLEARMGFIRQDRSTIRMSMLGLRDRGPALNGGVGIDSQRKQQHQKAISKAVQLGRIDPVGLDFLERPGWWDSGLRDFSF